MLPPEILPTRTLQDSRLQDLLAAWVLTKGQNRLPTHPADILRHLRTDMSKLVLVEVDSGGEQFRFRLVGEGVFPDLPELQVSRLVNEHPDKEVRLQYTTLLKATYGAVEPVRGVSVMTDRRQTCPTTESLWLPFGHEDKVEKILSMSVSINDSKPR